ncbi:MAG: orotate phosphoribosyltransferase [Bacteroidetes Order II. Incertae sedis bacterium]|nr:orotate phosphoribosyltransferase [Bacteroidetes Order II. bacterium]
MQDISQSLAESLVNIKAVSFSMDQPYTWTSGIKAPLYCDNRLTMGYPEIRTQIADTFAEMARAFEQVDIIIGTATAGIPHAAWLADRLSLPMAYVRASAKEHGKNNQIEGVFQKGQKAIVVEDLISTGGSVLQCITALQEAGVEVLAVFAVFSYQLPVAEEKFESIGIPVYTLTDLDALLDYADLMGTLRYSEEQEVRDWQNDPFNWMPSGL